MYEHLGPSDLESQEKLSLKHKPENYCRESSRNPQSPFANN